MGKKKGSSERFDGPSLSIEATSIFSLEIEIQNYISRIDTIGLHLDSTRNLTS